MKKSSILIAASVLLLLNLSAVAQDEYEEGKDVLEVSIYGGVGLPSSGLSDWMTGNELGVPEDRAPKTGWDFGLDIGYYVTPKFNLGINFLYTQMGIDIDGDSDHSHKFYNPNIYAKYSFEGESDFVPYIKVHFGLDNPKFSTLVFDNNSSSRKYRELSYDPAVAFGGSVGLFKYTSDFSGLFLEAGYHMALTEDTEGTYQDDTYTFNEQTGIIRINAGVRLIIGS